MTLGQIIKHSHPINSAGRLFASWISQYSPPGPPFKLSSFLLWTLTCSFTFFDFAFALTRWGERVFWFFTIYFVFWLNEHITPAYYYATYVTFTHTVHCTQQTHYQLPTTPKYPCISPSTSTLPTAAAGSSRVNQLHPKVFKKYNAFSSHL